MFVYTALSRMIPATRCFKLKRILLRWAGVAIEDNVRCVSSAAFHLSGTLFIGRDTWVGHEVLIVGGNAAVSIGKNCDLAPRVCLVTGSHHIQVAGPHVAGASYSLPISIGDGSWICAGAIILGGTTIGERSIVAAGAVVKGHFPAESLIAGIPARVLRKTEKSDEK